MHSVFQTAHLVRFDTAQKAVLRSVKQDARHHGIGRIPETRPNRATGQGRRMLEDGEQVFVGKGRHDVSARFTECTVDRAAGNGIWHYAHAARMLASSAVVKGTTASSLPTLAST